MPPAPEPLEPGTIIDISHESLMRVWTRLKDWVEREAESAAQYRRLVQNAMLQAKGCGGVDDRPGALAHAGVATDLAANAAWAERYHAGFEQAIFFLEQSRIARDGALLLEKEEGRRALRRARVTCRDFRIGLRGRVGPCDLSRSTSEAAIVAQKARTETEALNEAQKQAHEAQNKLSKSRESEGRERCS